MLKRENHDALMGKNLMFVNELRSACTPALVAIGNKLLYQPFCQGFMMTDDCRKSLFCLHIAYPAPNRIHIR